MNIFKEKDDMTFLSALLAIAALASTMAYILYKIFNNKAYNEKWKDYNDCGLA